MLNVKKLNDKVTFIGAKDPDLRVFDVFMKTPFGTTYNSYIINGGDEVALVDSAKEYFIEEYLEMLKKEVGDLKKVKYLITNHMEPDHSGEIGRLLDEMPHLKIVGTPSAQGFLKEIANKDDFEFIEVKEGTTLKVGTEELQFEIVPNMHWPETMVTYLKSTKQLFTCDIFGAHYCSDHVYADEIEEDMQKQFAGARKYYYTCIFKPFYEYVLTAMKKLSKFEIKELCCAHGCAYRVTKERNYVKESIEDYINWSNDHAHIEEDKIAICHTSAYGYTTRIAQEIAKAIEREGLRPVLVDLVEEKPEKAIKEILTSQAFLVGSPTINADTQPQIWDTLHSLSPLDVEGRLAGSFGSFGWSGQAIRNIESRLSQLKCEVYRPSLRIKFNPNSDEKLKKAYTFGEQFAKKVLSLKTLPKTDWAKIKTGKWKCLVCGEVFEGEYPPEECPVCGAPADQFVEILDKQSEFTSEDERKIVIIGGGVGAISAIESIRERNEQAPIVMCSDEKILPYYRILLSKKLCSELECEIKSKKWFEDNNVELRLNSKITAINKEHKFIETREGEHIGYDKLIIATGASPKCISTHGDDKRGVFCLRSRKDFDRIDEFVKSRSVKKAVVQGGGILGIEVASSLIKQGIETSVVEFAPRIMLRQLDDDGSEILQKHLKTNGLNIYTSETLDEIYGTGDDLMDVCGVELKNAQKTLECDIVIQNTGIVANKDIAQNAGLETNRGIIVDSFMQTTDENIYACGDCVEFKKYPGGLWAIAIEQGTVAGANVVGDSIEYFPKPISTSFNEFGYKTFSIGDYGYKESSKEYQVLELKDPKTEEYRKFYFLNNLFVGGILMGNTKKAVHLRKAIDKSSQIQTFLDAHFLDE